jgi:hypothetical protein
VTLTGSFWIYGHDVAFDGTGSSFQFRTVFTRYGARDVTLRNVSTGVFLCGGATDIRVEGGQIGPWTSDADAEDTQITLDNGASCSNVLISHVFFHDMQAANGSHTDCLQITAGTNITVSGNRFVRCSSDAIIAKADFGDIVNLVVENNWILDPINTDGSTPYAVGVFDDGTSSSPATHGCSSLIRNNSFGASAEDALFVSCRPLGVGNRVYGNILGTGTPGNDCAEQGADWAYNVWEHGPVCGAHARLLSPARVGFIDPSAGDLRLLPTSGARGRGDPDSYPTADIAGRRRPQGTLPDAGAYEVPVPAAGHA